MEWISVFAYLSLWIIFQHHSHEHIFNNFSINLPPIAFQLNLTLVQMNLNGIGIPFNVFELNLRIWIQVMHACNVIDIFIQMKINFHKINSFFLRWKMPWCTKNSCYNVNFGSFSSEFLNTKFWEKHKNLEMILKVASFPCPS